MEGSTYKDYCDCPSGENTTHDITCKVETCRGTCGEDPFVHQKYRNLNRRKADGQRKPFNPQALCIQNMLDDTTKSKIRGSADLQENFRSRELVELCVANPPKPGSNKGIGGLYPAHELAIMSLCKSSIYL